MKNVGHSEQAGPKGRNSWTRRLLPAVAVLAVLFGVVFSWNLRQKEARELEEATLHQFCDAARVAGHWLSEGNDFSMLVYRASDKGYRVRICTDTYTFEGAVDTREEAPDSLKIVSEAPRRHTMELIPLETVDSETMTYRIRVKNPPAGSAEPKEYTVRQAASLRDSDEFFQEKMEEILRMLNRELTDFYGTEMGVMDLELEQEGADLVNNGIVDDAGMIHGTGIIAPVSNGVFQLGSSEITFVIDPAALPMTVRQLTNTTTGTVLVDTPVETPEAEPSPEDHRPQRPETRPEEPATVSESRPEEPATVSEATWKQLYLEQLLREETYRYQGEVMYKTTVYLVDADGNEIPELYVCQGEEPDLSLCHIYDASTGVLNSKRDLGQPFVPYVAVHRDTGERVLYGDCGGMSMWDTMILRPVDGELAFETVVLEHSAKVWDDALQMQVLKTDRVSTEYTTDEFDVEYHTNSFSCGEGNVPEEMQMRGFLEF